MKSSQTSSSAIRIKNVSKQFFKQEQKTFKEFIPALFTGKKTTETFWALKNIDLDVKKGETVGIIGPNGSGKSTLLKLMAGVSKPSKGTVHVNGKVAPLIELGAGFHPELTGKENIYLNGSILGMDRKEVEKKFNKIVNFAELWDFIDQPIKHYSSGMYLRLAFAVAIHTDPDILLIDEILTVGDVKFKAKCFEKMRQFQKQKKTIIYVSHDLGSVRNFCSRVGILKYSKLQHVLSTDKAIDTYMYTQDEDQKKEKPIQEEKKDISRKSKKEEKNTSKIEKTKQTNEEKETLKKEKDASVKHKKITNTIQIQNVTFFTKDQKKHTRFGSGDHIEIVISYKATKDINNIVFGIALYKDDEQHVYGTNSLLQNKDLHIKKGNGTVRFIINKLPLFSPKIYVTVAAHTKEAGKMYDWKEKAYSFYMTKTQGNFDGFVYCDAQFKAS